MEGENDKEEQKIVLDGGDEIGKQFDDLLTKVTTFRSQITVIQQMLKNLEKTVRKEMKGLKRDVAKNKQKGNRQPSGFAKPARISNELCVFMERPQGTEIARTEVTQFIIQYITDNKLQNPTNRKEILPDKPLKDLLGVDEKDEITYFNIQKYMNKHFNSNNNAIST